MFYTKKLTKIKTNILHLVIKAYFCKKYKSI